MVTAMRHRVFILVVVAVLRAACAGAQAAPAAPDPATVRVRIGPLWLNPTLALTNAGIDTNVFNEAEPDQPKRDFTITVTPQSDLWLHMGRTWISGVVKEDLVWYKQYASERSGNTSYTLGWLVPLTRISFSVAGTWLKTRERPGFEIDARSERHEQAYNGSVEIRALSKTFFGVRGERRKVDFDKAAIFLGSSLQDELNRTLTTGALTLRHALTPLTSFTVDVAREQDRFEFSPGRDSDSNAVTFGLNFDPFAIINGSARLGFRDFRPLSSDVPGYSGTMAEVNLSYVALGSTKVGFQATRDVRYSYDLSQPYYLQTSVLASLAQQIFGPVDVEGRIGAQRLEYRGRVSAVGPNLNRIDHVRTYGGGVGYHMGSALRVAFNVDETKRESVVDSRQYNGLRYGTKVTYGF